jgi:hypothetical protein
MRRTMDEAHSNWPLTPDQRRTYREQCKEFLTPAFDTLYAKWLQTSSFSSTEVEAAAFPPCLLRVHTLGRKYEPGRPPQSSPDP